YLRKEFTVTSLAKRVPDEAGACALLEELRRGDDGLTCPHCGHTKAYFLNPKNGSRKTRTGSETPRRVWKCGKCRKQFSVLTGTIFQAPRSPFGPASWSCSRCARRRTACRLGRLNASTGCLRP